MKFMVNAASAETVWIRRALGQIQTGRRAMKELTQIKGCPARAVAEASANELTLSRCAQNQRFV